MEDVPPCLPRLVRLGFQAVGKRLFPVPEGQFFEHPSWMEAEKNPGINRHVILRGLLRRDREKSLK